MTDIAHVAEQVAREQNMMVPPDKVELDDDDFWRAVIARLDSEVQEADFREYLHPRNRLGRWIDVPDINVPSLNAPGDYRKKNPFTGYGDTLDSLLQSESKSPLVRQAITDAAEAVARVHRVPTSYKDGQPYGRVVTLNKRRLYGDFRPRPTPYGQDQYRLNRTHDHPALTLIHELGHGLDFGALTKRYGGDGDPNWLTGEVARTSKHASFKAFQQIMDRHRELEDTPQLLRRLGGGDEGRPTFEQLTRDDDNAMVKLMAAIYVTSTRRSIVHRSGRDNYAKYLGRPTELFARAYEQYVAERAEPGSVVAESLAHGKRNRDSDWYFGPPWYVESGDYDTGDYSEMRAEWERIEVQMDALFKEMGWNRSRYR